MVYKFKTLGMALITGLAICAVAAGVAQAEIKVTTAASPAVLTVSSIGKQMFRINPGGVEFTFNCTGISGNATVKNAETFITLKEIGYSGCSATIEGTTVPMTIDMEGCDFTFHGGNRIAEHHFVNGLMDLTCPGVITGPVLTVFTDAEHKTRICKYTVWNFFNHGEVTYTNTTTTPDDVDLKLTNIHFNVTKNEGILCPKSTLEALYSGEMTVKAFEDLAVGPPPKEGKQVGLTISE